MEKARVLVLTGSSSDLPRMEQCLKMLGTFGIEGSLVVASAHRSPQKVADAIRDAEDSGVEVIIAGAGMSAHLPGVVASLTNLPVIGVPLDSGMPGGMDALLSIVQMPPGIPVATVAVGGAKNAAVLAARMLSIKYPEVSRLHREYRRELEGPSPGTGA